MTTVARFYLANLVWQIAIALFKLGIRLAPEVVEREERKLLVERISRAGG